jgi:hypothetical protein
MPSNHHPGPLPSWRLGVLALCLLAVTTSPAPDPSPYTDLRSPVEWRDSRGDRYLFCLLGNRGEERARTIAVYQDRRGWQRIFLDEDRGFAPWALAVTEIDGDSLPEIAVAVYKKTRYDPRLANRLFIYDFTPDHRLSPAWLGSRLGLDFDAFAFAPAPDRIDRLLTVEHAGTERLVLRQYHWNGFGFSQDLDRVRIQDPDDYEQDRERLIIKMNALAKEGVPP